MLPGEDNWQATDTYFLVSDDNFNTLQFFADSQLEMKIYQSWSLQV